jgi:hypothetical protein
MIFCFHCERSNKSLIAHNDCVCEVVPFRSRVLVRETKTWNEDKNFELHVIAPLCKHFVMDSALLQSLFNGVIKIVQLLRIVPRHESICQYSFLCSRRILCRLLGFDKLELTMSAQCNIVQES